MKVLVIQSGVRDRFQETLSLVRSRWSQASVAVLVDEALAEQGEGLDAVSRVWAYRRGANARPVISVGIQQGIRQERFDVCAMSFGDRFGVQYWAFRLLPFLAGIPRVLTVNSRRSIVSSGPIGWGLRTLFACLVLRLVESLVNPARKLLDAGMLFLLTGLALGAAALQAAGLHPLRRGASGNGMPRLSVFIPSFGLGGAQTALINFIRGVDMRRYHVNVYTLDFPDKFFEPEASRLGVSLTYLPCAPGFPYWRIVWTLTKRLAWDKPDAAIGWLSWATAFTVMAGAIAGVPGRLMSLHSQKPTRLPFHVPFWQQPLDFLMSRVARAVVACSNACRDDYRAWACMPRSKMVTVYNGINEEAMVPLSSDERGALRTELGLAGRLLVGIVGRLSGEKDHHTFLEMIRLIRDRVPDVLGVVIGDGPDRIRLMQESARLGIADSVRFLGPRTDAKNLVSCLDVLVLTSLTEAFPNVLLEGQALGVPVVTTRAGGAPETMIDGETGYVVPCRDFRRLAARVVELLEDQTLRRRMGERGRAHVRERFASRRMADELLQLCGPRFLEARTPWPDEKLPARPGA